MGHYKPIQATLKICFVELKFKLTKYPILRVCTKESNKPYTQSHCIATLSFKRLNFCISLQFHQLPHLQSRHFPTAPTTSPSYGPHPPKFTEMV